MIGVSPSVAGLPSADVLAQALRLLLGIDDDARFLRGAARRLPCR